MAAPDPARRRTAVIPPPATGRWAWAGRAGPAAIGAVLALVLALPAAGTLTADVAADLPVMAEPTAGEVGPITLAGGVRPAEEVAVPVRVRIPSIGVDSPLVQLGVDGDGALVPPTDFARAGWFAEGPTPGEMGPAVLAGHVDSRDGPAVFFRLRDLVAGAEVLVDRIDGTTVRFTVVDAARYPKDAFPTEDVYGPTPRAELRLITCGGEFDRDRRSYRDNVVVTAVRA
jgi:hypothetical protein